MHIQVQGKQVEVGTALTEHVREHLAACARKYFDRPVTVTATFSRDAYHFCCDTRIHLPTGFTAKSEGRAADCYAAFAQAFNRLEKQVRRHKRRIRDHHPQGRKAIEAAGSPAYVLPPEDSAAGSEIGDRQPMEERG